MKAIKVTIISFLLTVTGYSQTWQWVNPMPQGNRLYDIKFIDNYTGYACGDAGTIIKTTNSGLNWISINSLRCGTFYKLFITGPGQLYVISQYDYAIRKTTDDGLTWNMYNTGIQLPYSLFFVNSNTGFIGGGSCVIRKTTNGGLNWDYSKPLYVNNGNVNSLYFFDTLTGFACTQNAVQKTSNGGNNWIIVYQDYPPNYYNSILFVDNLTGYVAGYTGNVRKTTDGGNSWVTLNTNIGTTFNSIAQISQNTLLFAGQTGLSVSSEIYKTTDAGGSFTNVFASTLYFLNSICRVSGNTAIACGSKGGIFESTDGGSSWASLSTGIYKDMGKMMFINSLTGFVTLNCDTLLKTTDAGYHWSYSYTGIPINITSIFSAGSGVIYAGGYYSKIIKSTNEGNNWIFLGNFPGSSILSMYFINPLTGYVSNDNMNNVYHTTDGGQSWDLQSVNPAQGALFHIVFVDQNTGFIGTGTGDMVRTTNGGINWYPSYHAPGGGFTGLTFPEHNTGYALNNSLYKTTNCGLSWFVTDTLHSGQGWGLSFTDANHGFVGGFSFVQSSTCLSISKTTNGGQSWISEYPGIYNTGPYGICALSSDTCFVTGGMGAILSYRAGVLGSTSNSGNIPVLFSLNQNYPNPFNPTTKISFAIPPSKGDRGMSSVRLVIYDALGSEIKTLVNGQLKPGTYEVDWDGTNYPSSVYFYRLSIGNEQFQTKKMVLLK